MSKTKMTDEAKDRIIGALRAGADMSIASRVVGACRKTLYNWMERDPKFAEAVSEARDYADEVIVKSLYDCARKGNVTAMIFWLKNRRRHEWRDRYDHGVASFDGKQLERRLMEARRRIKAVPKGDDDKRGESETTVES